MKKALIYSRVRVSLCARFDNSSPRKSAWSSLTHTVIGTAGNVANFASSRAQYGEEIRGNRSWNRAKKIAVNGDLAHGEEARQAQDASEELAGLQTRKTSLFRHRKTRYRDFDLAKNTAQSSRCLVSPVGDGSAACRNHFCL
jgi:hypothetical protein